MMSKRTPSCYSQLGPQTVARGRGAPLGCWRRLFPFVAHVAAAIFPLTSATAAAVAHLVLQRRYDDVVGDVGYATLVSQWHLTIDFELVVAARDPVQSKSTSIVERLHAFLQRKGSPDGAQRMSEERAVPPSSAAVAHELSEATRPGEGSSRLPQKENLSAAELEK